MRFWRWFAGFLTVCFAGPGLAVPQSTSPCAPHVAPVREIRSANIYGLGGPRAAPDAAAQAERDQLTADMNGFMRDVAQAASSPTRPACVLAALTEWAVAGALLGPLGNEAARKELIWNTAGLQIAYLKVRHQASADQAIRIESWLNQLSERVLRLFGRGALHNNVHAWVALTQAARAALSGSAKDWERARGLRADVLDEVDAEGWLRPELQRGRRALAYQLFALTPLLAHEALLQTWGSSAPRQDADRLNLNRLLRANLRALDEAPARDQLTERAGAPQDAPTERQRGTVLWLARCVLPGAIDLNPSASAARRTIPFERWLGGSVQDLCPTGSALNSAPPSPAPAHRASEP